MIKPNLAYNKEWNVDDLAFPRMVSPKLDGIRCLVSGGEAFSRSGKLIPSRKVQEWAHSNKWALDGLDGELIVGSETDANAMQNSMAVMSPKFDGHFSYHAFDYHNSTDIYMARLRQIVECYQFEAIHDMRVVPVKAVQNAAQLAYWEAEYVGMGYEGLIVRDPVGLYKHGRSTFKEGGLLKLKRFTDAEAIIIGYEEEISEDGKPKGSLGAFVVRSVDLGDDFLTGRPTFKVGTGFTAEQRRAYWEAREELVGELITYKSFEHGVVDRPRHPVFKSFRNRIDL